MRARSTGLSPRATVNGKDRCSSRVVRYIYPAPLTTKDCFNFVVRDSRSPDLDAQPNTTETSTPTARSPFESDTSRWSSEVSLDDLITTILLLIPVMGSRYFIYNEYCTPTIHPPPLIYIQYIGLLPSLLIEMGVTDLKYYTT